MTVTAGPNRASFAGNGVTTAFPFANYFLAKSDLVVTLTDNVTGAITPQILDTDYTVSGTAAPNGTYPNGGTVTFMVAPPTGKTAGVVRVPTASQAAHWVDGDPDPAIVKETAFDKLTLLVQRAFDLLGRTPTLPDGFVLPFTNTLPVVMTANSVLAVNSSGNGWTLIAAGGTLGTVTSVGISVPAEFSGSAPVTSAGTLTITKVNQVRNTVWAGPVSGSNAQPAFRALVAADIPSFALDTLSSGSATSGYVPVANGSGGIVWQSVVGTGTVTSVGITVPSEFSAGGAVTTSGNVSFTKNNQTANTVWAGPTTGSSAQPTFRNLVAADLPAYFGATGIANGTAGVIPGALAGQQNYFFKGDGTWAAGNLGTVTSIAIAVPAEFSVSGSPITSSGTITISKAVQVKNTFYAGPNGGANAAPTFRTIFPVDLPVMVGATSGSSGVAGIVPAPNAGEDLYFFRGDGTWSTVGVGTGTVQSVDLTMPADFAVAGGPVTGIGTFAVTYANQNANLVHAGPVSGGAAAPTWRSLVVADIPSGILASTLSSGAATNGQVLTANGLGGSSFQDLPVAGTVTSVALTVPGFLSVAGSPVTTSGTLAVSLATQSANTVFAGPTSGGAVVPTFRALVAADIPSLAGVYVSTALPSAQIIVGNASNLAAAVAMSGDVTIGNTGVTAIGANKVANSQLAQMAASSIKGNNTGGASNAADLTVTQVTAMLGINFAQGVPSGTVDGVNAAFSLASTPCASSSVVLFLDGTAQIQGTDYTISGTSITMATAPALGQGLYAFYLK